MAHPSPQPALRSAGVLLHVTSLPGRHGIGDLGPAAYAWVDALARAKQTWWQILPLGPAGDGDSPYQSYSAFAGNPLLISPDLLIEEGLLLSRDVAPPPFPEQQIAYPRVMAYKQMCLHAAWTAFQAGAGGHLKMPFEKFRARHARWLDDMALFAVMDDWHRGKTWPTWERDLARRSPDALRAFGREFHDQIQQQEFVQFLFKRQLQSLRRYAADRGVYLFGDLPIFVAAHSADVWSNPHLFLLEKDGRPKVVAGVPPDAFSKLGQRWGNPPYRWSAMKKEGYRWWIERFAAAFEQASLVRVDHFRGFSASWHIPAERPDAIHGRWVKGPGVELFDAVRAKLGSVNLVAEDLGVITPDVVALQRALNLPGMRVLQFAFDGSPDNPHLPHNYSTKNVVYTGTHDNDTTAHWYATLPRQARARVRRYVEIIADAPSAKTGAANARSAKTDAAKARSAGGRSADACWRLIRLAWASVADRAIVPAQDLLALPGAARMNTPGTGRGNWRWRLREGELTRDHLERLADLTELFGRAAQPVARTK